MKIKASACNFPRSREWAAKWIWHSNAPERNAWVLFRSELKVNTPDNARLFISADTRYRVWVNGTLLGDGPPQSQPYHQYYDERELAHCLRSGRNCIAVVVQHQGVQVSARGGLLAEVVDGNGVVLCASGSDWSAIAGKAWRSDTQFTGYNKIGPFQEHVDLRSMPVGWKEAGFDDSDWQKPAVISGHSSDNAAVAMPWCRMVPRDIEFIQETPVPAQMIQSVEECLDVANRHRSNDLSISLSQAGRAPDWARIDNPDHLLSGAGGTRLACSDRHQDGVTDGRYDPCITLDFGRVLTGYAEVEVEAPAGAHLEIGYAERLVDERFNNAIECPFSDRVIFAEGRNVFRPMIWRSFRYLRLRVKNCETGLRMHAVRAIEVKYPYKMRGAYQGDERMERVFNICRTTLELCSIESLMDTPFREQAQWLGDVAAVTLPGIYACFGDTRLPGKFIRQAAMNTRPTGLLANISNVASQDWQHDIPDYSLWWVIALWRHYLYTGDAGYIHECYPEMQRVMRTHLERINDDGLLDPMFGWIFIDWAHVDKDGVCAPYNAIFAGACDAAAAIASVKHDRWAEDVYRSAAKGVRGAFAGAFIRPEDGLVADAVARGKRSVRSSEHGNAAAIAFDCVDQRAADKIIDVVFDKRSVKTTEAQPFFMVVVLEALRKRGRTDLALRLIEERWGQRMLDRGRSSCTEEWYENGSWRDGYWQGFERTHSHAWSGCAADFLITGLAGIKILEPGCAKLSINPYKSKRSYEVVYPVPKGNVTVKWDGSEVHIDLPDGIEVV
jgi:alpha-L-rhamnosidase